jgi:hypothetical protein
MELSTDDPFRIWWGKGAHTGSFGPVIDAGDEWYQPFKVLSRGYIEFQFGTLRNRPAFAPVDGRAEMIDRLNELESVDIEPDAVEGFPKVRLAILADEASLARFRDVIDWFVGQVRSS